jgi:tetratricopeptide (TPR) repeat protein
MLGERGETDGALEHYTQAGHIIERLAAADPDNTRYQRDVSLRLDRIGDILGERGDAAGALEHYTRALHIREQNSAADPDNIQYQRDVWVSHYQIAAALESVGDPSAADHWGKAHHALAALDAAGKLPDSDRATYDEVTGKLGPN